jgi:penicillin-binding protein 2
MKISALSHKGRGIDKDGKQLQMYETRLRAVLVILGLALALLAAGLFQLQIVEGGRYRAEAQQRLIRSPGFYDTIRGPIYDRNGVCLARDAGAYDVAIYYPFIVMDDDFAARMARQWGVAPEEARGRVAGMWSRLASLTGVPETDLHDKADTIRERVKVIQDVVARYHGRPVDVAEAIYNDKTAVPHTLVADVDIVAASAIRARPEDFPGLKVVETARREYPQGGIAPHVIGRVGEVTREDLLGTAQRASVNASRDADDLKRYIPGDGIGRGGIENACEDILRGTRGMYLKGIQGDFQEDIQPVAGRDVHLTLDIALQADVEALLDRPPAGVGKDHVVGAAAVIDCRTGEVLVLATGPRYDPRAFRSVEAYNALRQDPECPLINRAVHGVYPLGSVFKAVTTLAGLEEGVLKPSDTYTCQGVLDPSHRDRFKCDLLAGHGTINLRTAIQKSCNVYFYHVAEALSRSPGGGSSLARGSAGLRAYAELLGLGRATGIGIGGEPAGQLDEPDARNLAIGQGSMLVTPLQTAQLYGMVATGGRMPALSLIRERPSPPRQDPGINPRYIAILKDGLEAVVNEIGGTAHSTVYLPDIRIAGKTGTAQAGGGQEPHAWFAGYAPADNPRVAFAVIVENGGHGGTAAGPIVREIVRKCQFHGYLDGRPKSTAAPAAGSLGAVPPSPPLPKQMTPLAPAPQKIFG